MSGTLSSSRPGLPASRRKNAGATASRASYACDGDETKHARRTGTMSACTDRDRSASRWTTEQRFHTLGDRRGTDELDPADTASSRSGLAKRKCARA